MSKPLLLFNERTAIGPLVRMDSPCYVEAEGLEEGDLVRVRSFDEKMIPVECVEFREEKKLSLDGNTQWLQAERVKSAGSRVNVFASTK